MKIIAKEWRSGKDIIGFIATEVYNGKWRAYIGVAEGGTENLDALRIAKNGTKLIKREAIAFFPYLKEEDFDEEK